MKKNDWIMIVLVLCVAGAAFGIHHYVSKNDAPYVTVTVNGDVYGSYELYKDQEIKINDTNVLVIKDKKADMILADCRDQICVNQKAISKNKETIVCLPNKVIAEVTSDKRSEVDAMAN